MRENYTKDTTDCEFAFRCHVRRVLSTPVFSIKGIVFLTNSYPVSKLRDSSRHKMINVEGYSAVSDGFVADESLAPDHGKSQRIDVHISIRTADVEALRSKCNFQLLKKPITRSKTSHKENRL